MRGLRRWCCGCVAMAAACLIALPILLVSSCNSTSGGGGGETTAFSSAMAVSNAGGSGGAVGTAVRTDLRPLFPWTPAGGFPTPGWPWGQCTWFVVYEGHAAGSHQVTWGGNANSWYGNAQARGALTDPPGTDPAPGWIAVFAPGHGSNPQLGHVAVVVGVQLAAGTYTVAEANVLGLGVVDRRTLWLGGTNPLLEGWIE